MSFLVSRRDKSAYSSLIGDRSFTRGDRTHGIGGVGFLAFALSSMPRVQSPDYPHPTTTASLSFSASYEGNLGQRWSEDYDKWNNIKGHVEGLAVCYLGDTKMFSLGVCASGPHIGTIFE